MKSHAAPRKIRSLLHLTGCFCLVNLLSVTLQAVILDPPTHVIAGELTAGGSSTAFLSWEPAPVAAYYEIRKRNKGSDPFVAHPSGNVSISGNTAAISGLDDFDTYEFAVVAVDGTGESDPVEAKVPYAPRRLPMSLVWNDQHHSPGASFDKLNLTLSTTSKAIPHNNPAYRVTLDGAGGLVVNATGTPIPIRFTGVNIVWSAGFPSTSDAPKIAARLAQFGINLVRFHNLDAFVPSDTDNAHRVGWFENNYTTLNATKMDLFDNFINELAKQGIYTNINLCTGRKFQNESDPTGPYQRFKGLDQMDPDMIQKQKDFASTLLNRTNPYRGSTAYKNDPAIAFLEINNENSLISVWASGAFEPGSSLPLTGTVYDGELTQRWSDWLRTTRGYGNANNAALQNIWAADLTAYSQAGTELLTDRNFANFATPHASTPWKFQPYSPAAGTCVVTTDSVGGVTRDALKVTVTATDTAVPDRVKILYSPVSSYLPPSFDYKIPHALRFHARVGTGEPTRVMTVGFRKNGSPYTQYHTVKIKLTSEWQEFDVLLPAVLTGPTTIDLTFGNLAAQTGQVWLSDVSLREGNPFDPASNQHAEFTSVIDSSDKIPETFPTSGSITPTTPWNNWYFVDKPVIATATFTATDTLSVYRNATFEAGASDIYLRRTELYLEPGRAYELSFDARYTALSGSAAASTRVTVSAGLDFDPFTVHHAGVAVVPKDTWTSHKLAFVASHASNSDKLRILLAVGRLRGTLDIKNVSLVENTVIGALGTDTLETSGNVAWPHKIGLRARTRAFQRDWMNFLWDTETAYFKSIRDYLKDTLGAHQLVIGSQGEFSPNYLQAQDMDVIDVHGYWNHPYSGINNQPYIKNNSMAGQRDGGALAPRQAKRILGKPFLCTEYNHPHPGTFGSEAFPLLAAFAGFHDWDGIVAFHYEDTVGSYGKGFEDTNYAIGRSTGKMVNFPFIAQAMRGDYFAAASTTAMLVVDKNTIISTLLTKLNGGVGVTDFTNSSVRPTPIVGSVATPLLNGFRALTTDVVTTMNDPLNAGATTPIAYAVQPSAPVPTPSTNPLAIFDSGDQVWDVSANAELAQIIAPKAKALIGKLVSGQTYDLLDGVSIVPSTTMQGNGATPTRYWAGYALTLKEGTAFGAPGSRWLVSTMGYTDNLFRKWESGHGPYNADNKLASGGTGEAPNFVERIRGTLRFAVASPHRLVAWDLDEAGNRIAPLQVTQSGGIATVSLPSSPVSPWYEFSVGLPSTALTLSFQSTDGYTSNATAISVFDDALAANATADTEAPFRNTAWVSTTADPGAADTDSLRAVTSPYTYAGDAGYALSLYDGGSGRGAKLDLRGQNIPLDKAWSFEAALRFESGSLNADEIHAVVGQDRDMPVVSVALVRDGSTTNYKLQLLTRIGWVDIPGAVANATYVKVKVTVNHPLAGGSNPYGTMTVYVDGTQKLTSSTLELPSITALPEELHLFTSDTTTGVARVDAIKITIP